MEPGNVYTPRDSIYWFPKGNRPKLMFPTGNRLKKLGGFRFPAPDPFRKDTVNSWYCRMCRRIIVVNVS